MNNSLGFTRITFIMMLGVFAAGTFALTQYAQAERAAHSHVSKGMCKMCGMPKAQCKCPMQKPAPQKKWGDGHGQRDMCHLKAPAPDAVEQNGNGKQGWWARTKAWGVATGASIKGWFKRSPKQAYAQLRDVTEEEFHALVRAGTPIVVKFHAVWCGVCKSMQPIDAQVQSAHPDVTFVQVDVDKHSDLATKQGAKGVPTYVFYNKGGRQKTQVGSMSADEFKAHVQSVTK